MEAVAIRAPEVSSFARHRFGDPWTTILISVLATTVAGTLAIHPARGDSRLNVLEALHYE